MKQLNSFEKCIYKEMLKKTNQYIVEIIKQDNFDNELVLERIANVMIVRLRKFLREMEDKEIYAVTKQMPALRKMKAQQRHKLVSAVLDFVKL